MATALAKHRIKISCGCVKFGVAAADRDINRPSKGKGRWIDLSLLYPNAKMRWQGKRWLGFRAERGFDRSPSRGAHRP